MTTSLPPRPGPRHALPADRPSPTTVRPAVPRPRPCPERPPVGSLRAAAPAVPLPARRRSRRARTVALVGTAVLALGLAGTVVVARSSPAVADDLRRLDVPIPFVSTSAPSTTTVPSTPTVPTAS
ncbi:hypothetical protein EV383_5871 [Pseudonocardia sediminis]|uniref:Uncharacterized protein n=1 Tax=Pseudonocardia sediminis TaxID=1397368 RepID=A0A4Q7V2V4_PSEST|nr:hypothetical protein [Pseudonocardia sediminis]RZT88917.1 hypothetical protein EV383_5871 [Pseudonocardia sediminis]